MSHASLSRASSWTARTQMLKMSPQLSPKAQTSTKSTFLMFIQTIDLTHCSRQFKIPSDTNSTAILTAYNSIPLDLSPYSGPKDGWLLDSLFQEVDISTGQVLFNWRYVKMPRISRRLVTSLVHLIISLSMSPLHLRPPQVRLWIIVSTSPRLGTSR